jgi:group I intron endonuclease
MKNYVVYKHTSPSGKAYIGITNNYKRRCREHQRVDSVCIAFYRAIVAYGWDNFTHEILEKNLSLSDANSLEGFYIKKFGSLSPNGYNLKTGGGSIKLSDETKIKIGLSNSGKKRSEEVIMVMRKISLGKRPSLETIKKRKESMIGKNLGKKRTDEARNNISKAMQGKCVGQNNPNFGKCGEKNKLSKTYKITDSEGAIYIVTGLKDFCRKNGLNPASMSDISRGKRNHHKGWKCEFHNEINDSI